MAKKPKQAAVFGPYELVDGVNSVMFGADPVIRLAAGDKLTTDDPTLAARLDAHPAVKKAK